MKVEIDRKRFLLPISIGLFTTPIVWEGANNLIGFGLMYFLGMYFILFNYPSIGIFLRSKPHYLEDITDENHKNYYIGIQNVLLSVLFGVIVDSIIVSGRDKEIIELFAIIGGNLSLFIRFQSFIGKILLIIFDYCTE